MSSTQLMATQLGVLPRSPQSQWANLLGMMTTIIIIIIVSSCAFAVSLSEEACQLNEARPNWIARDSKRDARHIFHAAMRPHMREMRLVRRALNLMRHEMMIAKAGEMLRPSALLAHAMHLARERSSFDAARGSGGGEKDERIEEGVEGVSMLNSGILDYLYQSDVLVDLPQALEMMRDMRRMMAADDVKAQIPPTFAHDDKKQNVLAALLPPLRHRNLSVTVWRANYDKWKRDADRLLLLRQQRQQPNKYRPKRQAQTGRNFPRNQWDPAIPISYYFDPSLNSEARRVVRMAVKFWTENTCLSFVENGVGTYPRVRFFAGGGCYSQVGRAFHSTEQMVSIGRGCEQFGIAAHEIGHTLGFFHGQARSDRDDYISVVYSNLSPQMATQFAKQSPENNYNFGVKYDYGSIMHYSDTDATTNRVTMLAKEKIYQHTMGNNVQPSFLDVYEMNVYYRCLENCPSGARCKNGGYRHPHDCNKCVCPSGFGGNDCGSIPLPENGPPLNCGRVVEARTNFQALSGSVSASTDYGLADRHATCWWHIRAPPGKRVELRVRSLSGACADGCFYGGTEIKTRDYQRVGARICCRSDIRQLGVLFTTDSELAVIGAFSQYKKQAFTVIYRAVEPSEVPPQGYSSYPPPAAAPDRPLVVGDPFDVGGSGGKKLTTSTGSTSLIDALAKKVIEKETGLLVGGNSKKLARTKCADIATNCYSLLQLCDNSLYTSLMELQCRQTCMKCDSIPAVGVIDADGNIIGVGGGDSTTRGGEGGSKLEGGGACLINGDHENCANWLANGFCVSPHYSVQIKQEICPRACNLCR